MLYCFNISVYMQGESTSLGIDKSIWSALCVIELFLESKCMDLLNICTVRESSNFCRLLQNRFHLSIEHFTEDSRRGTTNFSQCSDNAICCCFSPECQVILDGICTKSRRKLHSKVFAPHLGPNVPFFMFR